MEVDRHEPELIGTIGWKGRMPCVTPIITSSVAKGVYEATVDGKKTTGYIKITKGENEKIHCEVIN